MATTCIRALSLPQDSEYGSNDWCAGENYSDGWLEHAPDQSVDDGVGNVVVVDDEERTHSEDTDYADTESRSKRLERRAGRAMLTRNRQQILPSRQLGLKEGHATSKRLVMATRGP